MADELSLGWLKLQTVRQDDVGALARATIDGSLRVGHCNSSVLNAALADARLEHRREVEPLRQASAPQAGRAPTCPGCRLPVDDEAVTVLTRARGEEEDQVVRAIWHKAMPRNGAQKKDDDGTAVSVALRQPGTRASSLAG